MINKQINIDGKNYNLVPVEEEVIKEERITDLTKLSKGDIVIFNDNTTLLVGHTNDIDESVCEGDKSFIMIKTSLGVNYGYVNPGYADSFKKGDYKEIIKKDDCHIEIVRNKE